MSFLYETILLTLIVFYFILNLARCVKRSGTCKMLTNKFNFSFSVLQRSRSVCSILVIAFCGTKKELGENG